MESFIHYVEEFGLYTTGSEEPYRGKSIKQENHMVQFAFKNDHLVISVANDLERDEIGIRESS